MKIITNGKRIISAGDLQKGIDVEYYGPMADLDKYYFEDGELHLRVFPYKVEGETLRGVPVPSTLHVAGMVYQITESEVELTFATDDDYDIRIEPQDYMFLPLYGSRRSLCKK
jgi:hypothetical protein